MASYSQENLEKAIEDDRKAHEHCNYGTSMRQMCKNVNNKYLCEVINSAIRYCPHERPVTIIEHREESDGGSRDSMLGTPDMHDRGSALEGGIGSIMDELERGILGSFFGDLGRSPRWQSPSSRLNRSSPHEGGLHRRPPHSYGISRRDGNSDDGNHNPNGNANGKDLGRPAGPVERI